MIEEWGSVDGDINADAIISDRLHLKRVMGPFNLVVLALTLGCGIWYALSASQAAIALEIFLAAYLVAGWIQHDLYQAETMILIAERRIQLVEQKLQEMQFRGG